MKTYDKVLSGITRSPLRGVSPAQMDAMLGAVNPRHAPARMHNRVQLEVVGPDEYGNRVVKQRGEVAYNIMATYGLNRLCELVATGGEASGWAAAARIGTDTTAATSSDNNLVASTGSVALTGASMDASDQGNRTLRYVMTFASDNPAGAAQIREIGLFATSNVTTGLIARSDLTGAQSVNKGASDEIRCSYDIVYTTA